LGYIPLDDLVVIYNLASIYLHLSYAEGFGLPILEAMSCGLPVISSDTASISEISSDASIMLNPNNHQDIVRNIFALLDNYNFRNNLMHKGLINAKKYSWYKCALNTYEIYNKIIFQKL
jgi:glycosyltransferase involved in cell wall biosynthesis